MEISLREWRNEDIVSLLKHADNSRIARFMTNSFPHPYTQKDGEAFLKRVKNLPSGIILAIDVDGEAVGSIGVFPQDDIECKNAEMGYWLSEQHWSKGIITRAVSLMIHIAFEKFDIDRIYARPFGNNPASIRVLEKSGFSHEATIRKGIYKNGEYRDLLIYGIRRDEVKE